MNPTDARGEKTMTVTSFLFLVRLKPLRIVIRFRRTRT